jgi:hypothetical protein
VKGRILAGWAQKSPEPWKQLAPPPKLEKLFTKVKPREKLTHCLNLGESFFHEL